MTEPASWWHVKESSASERGRWFGVFRRNLAAKTDLPKRVTIPQPGVHRAETLAEVLSPTSAPGELVAGFALSAAAILGGFGSSDSRGGSVTLAELAAPEDASVSPARRTQGERRLSARPCATSVEQELPLWKRLLHLLQLPTALLLSPQGPLDWPAEPFAYQKEGIVALYERDALLLADDMGLGKTIQAIAALRLLIHQRQAEEALIVTPASLVTQWQRELRNWAPELRVSVVRGRADDRSWQWAASAHIFITSYETLRSDFTANPASPPRRREWGVVVLDEAQKIKNRDTEVSGKCKLLPRRRAWALTGTPLENRVEDLASILEFVTPLKGSDKPLKLAPGPALQERHHAVQLRRKKSEVLPQLPPKVVSHIQLTLGPAQRACYDRAEREGIIELTNRGETIRIEHVLELITRLKQICNFCPGAAESAKLDDIRERMTTLTEEGHRAIIFSQFTDRSYGCQALAAALEDYRPLLYTGELSSSRRDAIIQEFRDNPDRKALVLSLRAGGQGLNLQEASYVFHFDRWWNPAIERQAEDRSHRLGQLSPVNVYKYTCEGTLEERIDQILREKQVLFDELIDDVSIDLSKRMTQEEIFGLFGLTPPAVARTASAGREVSRDYAGMTGEEFEQYLKGLLEHKGWRVEATPRTRDAGLDLIARRQNEVGAEVVLYVQCKNWISPCGVEVVRQLSGAMPRSAPGAWGVVACPGGFTADAAAWAKERGLLLWERQRLFELSA